MVSNTAFSYFNFLRGASIDFSLKLMCSCRLVLIIFFLMITKQSSSQDSILSFENAVIIALEKNFDVQISENTLKKLDNLNTIGQAGMLPDLSINGSYSHADNSTKQEYSNGDVVDRTGAITENLNADLSLDWTIFDGLRMFSSKKKLGELTEQGRYALKIQMEDVILQVTKAYHEISRQQQLLRAIREEINYALERNQVAERRFSNGSGSKLDLLQIKTDLNARLSAELNQKSRLKAASIELNRLLESPPGNEIIVSDTTEIKYRPSLEDLKKSSSDKNNFRLYLFKQVLITEYSLKETTASRWPQIKLNSSYAFTDSKNDAGFIRQNRNQGFSYGIAASLPLFGGMRLSREIKNAKLDLLNSRLELEQSKQVIDAELLAAYENFQNVLAILDIEENNIISEREIMTISQEKFRLGSFDILDLKDVQRSFEESMNRLVDARYEAKYAEAYLKQLAGELIK